MLSGRVRTPSLAARLAICCLIQPQGCTLAMQSAPKPTNPGPPARPCPHIPAPRPSVPPRPAAAALPQFLQPGHWEWDNGNYAWTPPEWRVRPAAIPPRWRDGYWEANGGACVWHNGHFLPPGGTAISATHAQ